MSFILREHDIYLKFLTLKYSILKNATLNIILGEQFHLTVTERKKRLSNLNFVLEEKIALG